MLLGVIVVCEPWHLYKIPVWSDGFHTHDIKWQLMVAGVEDHHGAVGCFGVDTKRRFFLRFVLHACRLARRPTASSGFNSSFLRWPLRTTSHCQDIFLLCENVQLSCCKNGLSAKCVTTGNAKNLLCDRLQITAEFNSEGKV